MAYFKNLFPELQQDDVRKPAGPGGPVPYEPKEQYPSNPQELFSGYGPTPETVAQQNAHAAQIRPAEAPKQEGPNVKAEYTKAAAIKAQEWSNALKEVHTVSKAGRGLHDSADGPIPSMMLTDKDKGDISTVLEKLGQKSDRPDRLADDLRVIASRRTIDPKYGSKLIRAAEMLDRAAKADQFIEGLQKPGQPLGLTQQDATLGLAEQRRQIASQQESLTKAGSLRKEEGVPALMTAQRGLAASEDTAQKAGLLESHVDDTPPTLDSQMVAAGWRKGDFLKRALALQGTLGLNMSQAINPGSAGFAIANMLKSMGDVGVTIMSQMAKDVQAGRRSPEQGARGPGQEGNMPDPYEARIRDREARFEQAYQELKQLKSFDSMWDVVFYVLFSMMMGPGPAAVLFTNKARKGQLDSELKYLQGEIENISRRQESGRRMQEDARRFAAQSEFNERKFSHQVQKDDFYMGLRQSNPQGKDPVLDNLMGGYRLWQDELDEAEKVLSNQFDFNESEIKAARARRLQAAPAVQKARNNILRYQAQKLSEAQGAGK